MLLAIDVGNTNTVLGAFEGASLRHQWRVETSQSRTYDEWGILARQLYASVGLDPARVRAIAISSVVPPLAFALEQMAQDDGPATVPADLSAAAETPVSTDETEPVESDAPATVENA